MAIDTRFAALPHCLSTMSSAIMLMAIVGLCLAAPTSAQAQMAEDCDFSMEQPWPDDLVASAHVSGLCNQATIDLVVRNGVDEVVWSASYESQYVFGFEDILEAEPMQAALTRWLTDYVDVSSTDKLPDWPEGADMPDGGEFPFYVEEGLSRADYQKIRSADYPMICYVQGIESSLCLIRQPDINALTSIGAQSFPG